MSREWKPGDVGVHSTYGYRGIYVPGCPKHERDCWHNESGFSDPGSDDRRPLVVIDPEDREQVDALMERFFAEHKKGDRDVMNGGATDAMQAALRSLVAEPEPEEPTGLGAVAEARSEIYVIDKTTTTVRRWKRARGEDGGRRHAWADLPRPLTVLSPGWEPES